MEHLAGGDILTQTVWRSKASAGAILVHAADWRDDAILALSSSSLCNPEKMDVYWGPGAMCMSGQCTAGRKTNLVERRRRGCNIVVIVVFVFAVVAESPVGSKRPGCEQ